MARRLQPIVLPGTDMNTSWLLSMETLAQNFGGESDIHVNYRRYRFLQICAVYSGLILGKARANASLIDLRSRMTVAERVLYDLPLAVVAMIALTLPLRYRELIASMVIRATGSHPAHASANIEGRFTTILDAFENVSPKTARVFQEH